MVQLMDLSPTKAAMLIKYVGNTVEKYADQLCDEREKSKAE